jgi:hypothetical protein
MNNLGKSLDILLHEGEEKTQYIYDAQNTASQLEDLKREIDILNKRIMIYHNRMCADLCLLMRRILPSLNISMSRGSCIIGYNKNSLTITPDTRSGVWSVKSSQNSDKFAKRFMQRYASKTIISDDLNILAQAVVSFFLSHYKSLGESITGSGVILIEGQKSNVYGLIAYHQKIKDENGLVKTQNTAL